MTDGRTGRVAGTANHAPEQLVSQLEDTEELDTLSRPRLTQEQIAILEDEFKGKPKPATDFKKQLAAQIGLSLQRVNVSLSSILADKILIRIIELVSKPPCQGSASKAASGEQ